MPGGGGEVDVAETEETLGSEGLSVLEVIFEQNPSHSPALSGCGHRTSVNVKSQTLLRGGHLLLLVITLRFCEMGRRCSIFSFILARIRRIMTEISSLSH